MTRLTIPRLETIPALLQFAQTKIGKIVFLILFSLLAYLQGSDSYVELPVALLMISLFPDYRRQLVAVATFWWVIRFPSFEKDLTWFSKFVQVPEGSQWLCLAVFFLLTGLLLFVARRFPDNWLFKRPVRNLLIFYTTGLLFASYAPLPSHLSWFLWLFLMISGKYLWFIAYSLTDKTKPPRRFSLTELFHYQPFWGSSNVPYPKGDAYLRKIEAKNPLELAVSQIKGLKLMLWTTFLIFILSMFRQVVYGQTGFLEPFLADIPMIPSVDLAIHHSLIGKPFPQWICWLVLVLNFLHKILSITCTGGTIIATCRMAGFNALRNTYKPLYARTIAEFYNRLFYYFKELLVDFFFYPAYFRFFKNYPRFRVFFATVAAAGFGNALYHFLRDIDLIIKMGFWNALIGFQVYILYSLILGISIGISQLRAMNTPSQGRSIFSTLFVLLFYCLLMVLDDPIRSRTIADYAKFMLYLFVPYTR